MECSLNFHYEAFTSLRGVSLMETRHSFQANSQLQSNSSLCLYNMILDTSIHDPSSSSSQLYTLLSETDRTFAPPTEQNQNHRGANAGDEPRDFSRKTQDQSSSVETVKPYAIEEPDDNPTSELDEQPQNWDNLVNSMKDLYCDSDNGNPRVMHPNRGRKRKPTDFGIQSDQSFGTTPVQDLHYQEPSLSPKRRRRRDKPLRESLRSTQSHRGSSESSDNYLSTDTSEANTANGSQAPDEMDID